MFDLFPMQCEKMVEGLNMLGGSPFNIALVIIVMIAAGVGMFLLVNLLFKWLWNTTIPEVFGLKALTFWQAFRILVIVSLLFGGFGGHNFIGQ